MSLKKISLLFMGLITVLLGQAQDGKKVEMADVMRSNGKIYVVVAVVVAILIGLFIYVITVDRKISKLEKHAKP